jgi:hypothetical protein
MARDLYAYRDVAVHLVADPRSGRLQVRPMPGQAFATTMRVQCARALLDHPPGTCFLLLAKMTDRLGGEPFLYAYHGDPVKVLTPEAAKRFLAEFKRGRI